MRKIKIMFLPSQKEGGVFYYRTLVPMLELKRMFGDDYDVFITNDIKKAWEQIADTDILIVHNCIYSDKMQMRMWNLVTEARKIGVKTILDMDDYWNYGEQHPLYSICMNDAFPIKAAVNLNLFDYITTTTDRFANEIRLYTRKDNVVVLPNAISSHDPQFTDGKDASHRIRFGLTGGASHTNDVKQIIGDDDNVMKRLSGVIDRIQFVLCGFNLQGKKIVINEDGSQTECQLQKDEIWWIDLEKKLTDNYSIVSKEYKDVLLRYDESSEDYDASNEPYRRVWNKSIVDFEYGKIYNGIDVLLVPLTDTKFNSMKSELKLVESGFTNTAAICSKVHPYVDFGTEGKDCVFVGDMTPKGWSESVLKLVNDDKLRTDVAHNLRGKVLEERNLAKITQKRDELYKSVLNL